jgi:hypothetical protein
VEAGEQCFCSFKMTLTSSGLVFGKMLVVEAIKQVEGDVAHKNLPPKNGGKRRAFSLPARDFLLQTQNVRGVNV